VNVYEVITLLVHFPGGLEKEKGKRKERKKRKKKKKKKEEETKQKNEARILIYRAIIRAGAEATRPRRFDLSTNLSLVSVERTRVRRFTQCAGSFARSPIRA